MIDFREIEDEAGKLVEETVCIRAVGDKYFSGKGKSTFYRDLFLMALCVGRDKNPYATAQEWVSRIVEM